MTEEFGTCLALDGIARVFSTDEFIFHESFVHPIMLQHPNPTSILLAGDGDGGSVREILKHNNVSNLDWIEIDQQVVEVSKKYLQLMRDDDWKDPRLNLIISDARNYIKNTSKLYDVIFISVTELMENNPSQALYTREFLMLLHSILKDNGIVVQSVGSTSFGYWEHFCKMVRTFRATFPIVTPFQVGLPSFGINWGFIAGFKNEVSIDEKIFTKRHNLLEKHSKLKFFEPNMRPMLFTIPAYLRQAIDEANTTYGDSEFEFTSE